MKGHCVGVVSSSLRKYCCHSRLFVSLYQPSEGWTGASSYAVNLLRINVLSFRPYVVELLIFSNTNRGWNAIVKYFEYRLRLTKCLGVVQNAKNGWLPKQNSQVGWLGSVDMFSGHESVSYSRSPDSIRQNKASKSSISKDEVDSDGAKNTTREVFFPILREQELYVPSNMASCAHVFIWDGSPKNPNRKWPFNSPWRPGTHGYVFSLSATCCTNALNASCCHIGKSSNNCCSICVLVHNCVTAIQPPHIMGKLWRDAKFCDLLALKEGLMNLECKVSCEANKRKACNSWSDLQHASTCEFLKKTGQKSHGDVP